MSAPRAQLERLCRDCGIATGYHDIWGNWLEVSDAILLALLDAFGINARTAESAAEAERVLHVARWSEGLESVRAVPAHGAPWRILVRAPAGAGLLRWRLEEEGGAWCSGEVEAAALRETGCESVDGVLFCERELEVGVALEPGYHRLQLAGAVTAEAMIIATPPRCYRPAALGDGGRVWGPAVQLYALRSLRNWGMGDFGDLRQLVADWAALGADIVGLNPLHALFLDDPARASPYSPSTRQWLNALYLDVEAIKDFAECDEARRLVQAPGFQARLAKLRALQLVDYAGVAAAKLEVLERLYAYFRTRHLETDSPSGRAFREFQARGGVALRRHALFEALQASNRATDLPVRGWQGWRSGYHDPDGHAVARFTREQVVRIEFYEYLQWQAECQLNEVSECCASHQLGIGLYLDLAVSVDSAGSDAWSNQRGYALGVGIGAPPDDFSPQGQDWELPPLRPDRLRSQHYAPLRRALAQGMRAAGALRIDHVMGLLRLFWVPAGAAARDGAYVHYRMDEQLAIVALESHRNRCLVIGEDLGTVSEEARRQLAQLGAFSCRLLYFERQHDGEFRPGTEYPLEALVAVGSHDLPTLAGWWAGYDVQLRRELGLISTREAYEWHCAERARDRLSLVHLLQREGLLSPDPGAEEVAAQPFDPAVCEAAHVFLAASPAQVMMVQLEDVLGVSEQANLPSTIEAHPNWRRKLPEGLAALRANPRLGALARRLAKLRPSWKMRR